MKVVWPCAFPAFLTVYSIADYYLFVKYYSMILDTVDKLPMFIDIFWLIC